MAVVSKPSGMLSVPGKSCRLSVESIVREHYGIAADVPVIVHRLDMDTSGLLLIARTREAHKALQQQFLDHTVSKSYLALLEGVPHEEVTSEHVVWHSSHTGTITLPLRPDLDDRPRQLVDFVHGKPAVTRFRLLKVIDGHQLKVKLLSDPDHELMEKVGAWGTKASYGKETVGTIRSTFIVGKDGRVEALWRNVKVAGHVEKVLSCAVSCSKRSE